jgi:hypothetical protein
MAVHTLNRYYMKQVYVESLVVEANNSVSMDLCLVLWLELNVLFVTSFDREIHVGLYLLQIKIMIIVVVNGFEIGCDPWRNETTDIMPFGLADCWTETRFYMNSWREPQQWSLCGSFIENLCILELTSTGTSHRFLLNCSVGRLET